VTAFSIVVNEESEVESMKVNTQDFRFILFILLWLIMLTVYVGVKHW